MRTGYCILPRLVIRVLAVEGVQEEAVGRQAGTTPARLTRPASDMRDRPDCSTRKVVGWKLRALTLTKMTLSIVCKCP